MSAAYCFGDGTAQGISLLPHSAFTEGGFYVTGNDKQGNLRMWGFDVVKWIWVPYTSTMPNFQAPDLFSFGGYVIAVGGTTDDFGTTLSYISTSVGPTAANWVQATIAGVPKSHDGHRMIVFGGILYMMGGITASDSTPSVLETSNAMWAFDLNSYFNQPSGTQALSWFKIQPIGSAGVWSPRVAFSLNVYSATILLFGGLKRNENAVGNDPICANPGAQCITFNDVWQFQPGLSSGPISANSCNNGNCGWSLVAVSGNQVPTPRYNHASGVLADNLYVFGGVTATGTYLTDLWLFNIEDSVWRPVTSTFQGTDGFVNGGFAVQSWPPSMAVVGHNLYIEMTGDAGGNAIYRWVPEAPAPSPGGGSGNSGSSAAAAVASGHTAGIVLGLLLGLANLYVLVLIAKNNNITILQSPLGGSAYKPAATNDGFYTSTATVAGGGYSAPPTGL